MNVVDLTIVEVESLSDKEAIEIEKQTERCLDELDIIYLCDKRVLAWYQTFDMRKKKKRYRKKWILDNSLLHILFTGFEDETEWFEIVLNEKEIAIGIPKL